MSDRQTKYIVSGSAGEYSDYRSWVVSVYDTEAEATAACDALNGIIKGFGSPPPTRHWEAYCAWHDRLQARLAEVDDHEPLPTNGLHFYEVHPVPYQVQVMMGKEGE